MANRPDSFGKSLARIERELEDMKFALGLLGAKPCCACGKFYLSANPGNLFHADQELVCYQCLSHWWSDRCPQLRIAERQRIEHKLMRWLIEHHHAQVFRDRKELSSSQVQDVHLVLGCFECNGTGAIAGERCHHCLGNGNVWVITFQ